jgi:hypothetical protein
MTDPPFPDYIPEDVVESVSWTTSQDSAETVMVWHKRSDGARRAGADPAQIAELERMVELAEAEHHDISTDEG